MTCLVAKHSNFEGPVIRRMYKYNDNICDACLAAWSIWPDVCSQGKIFIPSEKFKTKFDISLTQVCCFWSRNIHVNIEQSHPLKVSYFECKFWPLVFQHFWLPIRLPWENLQLFIPVLPSVSVLHESYFKIISVTRLYLCKLKACWTTAITDFQLAEKVTNDLTLVVIPFKDQDSADVVETNVVERLKSQAPNHSPTRICQSKDWPGPLWMLDQTAAV